MAVKGTEKVLGGTRATRYPDPPVKGTPNGYGLYPWSAFRASLSNINAISQEMDFPNTAALDTPASIKGVEFLLFTSDIPAILTAVSYDTVNYVSYPSSAYNSIASLYILSATKGGSTGVTGAQYGKVLSGYAGAGNTVFCTGFAANGAFHGPNGEQSDQYVLECISNGPVISAPVGPITIYKGTTLAPIPVILTSADYKQAMYDAGNIYTAPSGRLFQIVGLYYPIANPT